MSLFAVTKEIQFDAGHRVPMHASKCRNPHGHRYRVVACLTGALQQEGSSTGMVLDFGDIKTALTEKVHDVFDHGFIVKTTDDDMVEALNKGKLHLGWKVIYVPFDPTAENLAKHFYDILDSELLGVEYVEVWETPTSMARYPV